MAKVIVRDDVPKARLAAGINTVASVTWKEVGYGIALIAATPEDRKEFGPGTFRAAKGELGRRGEQPILKISPKLGTIYFLNQDKYLEGEVVWDDSSQIRALYVYDSDKFNAAFGQNVLQKAVFESAAPALSFTEKRALQKTVSTNLAALAAGNVAFTEKRRLQKEITEAMSKLGAKSAPPAPSRTEWEAAVIRALEEKMEVTTSDAQGIMDGQAFAVAQAWGQGLDAAATADKIIAAATPGPKTKADLDKVWPLLQRFIGESQLSVVRSALRGEEAQFFIDKMLEIASVIQNMPKTYETDGQGDSAMAYLHYFYGGSDWYITEKDKLAEQDQAFGYSVLNGDTQMAETGYISITELIESNVELDFYWTPKTLAALKGKKESNEAATVASVGAALEARGWQKDGERVWKYSAQIDPSFSGTGAYLVSGTESTPGKTGWMLTDVWDENAWVPLGGSFSLLGSPDKIASDIMKLVENYELDNAKSANPLLLDLQAGKFDDLDPMAFLGKLKLIADQLNDIEPLKAPAIAYIEKNRDKVTAIMESAVQEAFGKFWSKGAAA